MSENPVVVWAELPVIDLPKAIAFYSKVFSYDMSIDSSGPNPMATLGAPAMGVGAHLYPGKPSAAGTGATIHLAVPDTLEATRDRCQAAGGKIISDAITIPPGRFIYALDPDGNSLGLFEPA